MRLGSVKHKPALLLSTGTDAIMGEALTKPKNFFQSLIMKPELRKERGRAVKVKRFERKSRVMAWQT